MEKIPFRKPLMLIVGCLLCSIATNWVAIPNGFAVTGVTGLSMTLSKFIGVNYALIYYGITLLILFITWLTLGKKDMSNIVILSVMYPAVLWILNLVDIKIIFQEKLIAVACFGVIYGLGAGIPYRLGYSYGGSDTLAKILKKLKKAGLVRSIAGSQGGYMLVKRPEEITLGEIISTTETTMKINRCLEADTYCSRNATATCMIRKYYQILQNEIDNVVLKRTIGDILNERYTKP